jgi:hypothetical protein
MSGRRFGRRAHNTSGPSDGVGASNTRRCETSDREPFRRRTPEGPGVKTEVVAEGPGVHGRGTGAKARTPPRRRPSPGTSEKPTSGEPAGAKANGGGPGLTTEDLREAKSRAASAAASSSRRRNGTDRMRGRSPGAAAGAGARTCLRPTAGGRRPDDPTTTWNASASGAATGKRQVGPSGGDAATPARGSKAAKGRTPGAPPVAQRGVGTGQVVRRLERVAEHRP